ncbi:hypothetical protein ACJ41O_010675 [Fusarium nematophilum]
MPAQDQPQWFNQPGLFPKDHLEHIPPFRCGQLRAQPPDRVDDVLPVIDPQNPSEFVKTPDTDHILVALDFEHLCMTKIGRYADGTQHRYHPVTEAGVAYLDMRTVIQTRGRGIMPGDRGSSWFRLMTPLHYIVEEYASHWGHLCRSDWLHVEPYLFAFGKSKIIKEKDLEHRLYRLFTSLRKMNRLKEEIQHNHLRELILLMFDSRPVEETLSRLGFGWLAEPNVRAWDLQRDMQLELRFSCWPRTRLEHVLESLGLRFEDGRFGNLANCAGNAAVFAVQALLALFYKDGAAKDAFAARGSVEWLRYTWVGHALDQTNVEPGGEARRREEREMNRHDVPQRRDEEAFR